jgi:hypothetical protein
MAWTEPGWGLMAFAAVMLLFSAVAVTLRLVSRRLIRRKLKPTDWSIVLTLLCTAGHTIGLGFRTSSRDMLQ